MRKRCGNFKQTHYQTVGTESNNSTTTSTTTYSYQGNTVTVTDATSKWKKFAIDAFGNLTQVNEPNPAGGSDYVTTYTYDVLGNLTGVSMPRSSVTQIRSFTYSGHKLISATNPENGAVSYTYNSYNKIATKRDQKGQDTVLTYDSMARLTKVQRYPQGSGNAEDTCQRENYSYDTNPYNSTFSQNASGRMTAIQYYGGPTCNTTFTEMYSYNTGGAKVAKRIQIARSGVAAANLEADYAYDNEGRMTAVQYPSSQSVVSGSVVTTPGPNLGTAYDAMGRPSTLTDLAANSGIISSTSYGPAGELLSMSGPSTLEYRNYNSLLQLTYLANLSINFNYTYSATQNNGKIMSQTDNVTGEQVVYTYDTLNRLASATATNNSWGQSYGYDGFGNLTDQNVTAGSAPAYHVVYNYQTNRQTGDCADANGNINSSAAGCGSSSYNYDVANRIVSSATANQWQYSYASRNKRVWRGVWTSGTLTTDEVAFWGLDGTKLGTWALSISSSQLIATATVSEYYFAGRLIKNASGYIGADRLGSVGKYYPYGQEKPSATANGTEKFTGYLRDSETGNDYAINRYHAPGQGRFLTTDPSRKSVQPTSPGSWNRYAYVEGDPTNNSDPSGLSIAVGDPGTGCVIINGVPSADCDGGEGGGPGGGCSSAIGILGALASHSIADCVIAEPEAPLFPKSIKFAGITLSKSQCGGDTPWGVQVAISFQVYDQNGDPYSGHAGDTVLEKFPQWLYKPSGSGPWLNADPKGNLNKWTDRYAGKLDANGVFVDDPWGACQSNNIDLQEQITQDYGISVPTGLFSSRVLTIGTVVYQTSLQDNHIEITVTMNGSIVGRYP